MNKKQVRLIHIIGPVGVIILVQQAMSIFLGQLAIAYVIFSNMPIKVSDLQEKCSALILSKDFLVLLNFASGILCAGIFIFWYIRIKSKEKVKENDSDNKRSPLVGVLTALGIIGIAFGCRFSGAFLINILVVIFPSWLIAYQSTLDSIGLSLTGNAGASPVVILYAVLVAPIMEEYAFRGISLSYASKRISIVWANLVQALLFALLHGNMLQGTYTFLFGLILGIIVIRTGRLWISIIIHIIFNAVSIFLTEYIYIGDSPFISYLILFISMTAIYAGVTCIEKAYSKTLN